MSLDNIEVELEIDTAGLKCPLPILKAKKALADIQSGEILKVITTDPHAEEDFQAFCAQTGHQLLAQTPFDEGLYHYLQKR